MNVEIVGWEDRIRERVEAMLRLWDSNSKRASCFAAARHQGKCLHHSMLAHSLPEVMFSTSSAAFSCHITVIMYSF